MSDRKLSMVDSIPHPDEIKFQLARNAREARLLRSLLELARRKAEAQQQNDEHRAAVAAMLAS
jgi:hypothetical protein